MNLQETVIGVVGAGVVGRATARVWEEHCKEVVLYDVDFKRSRARLADLARCQFIFLCLPTPSKEDGRLSTEAIDSFLDAMRTLDVATEAQYILRSTVPVGTTQRLADQYQVSIVHNPEFLTARCADQQAQNPSRVVIGMPQTNVRFAHLTVELYVKRFPHTHVQFMFSKESELIKLIQNAFFSTKVAFFNEARDLVDAHGGSWISVLNGILSDHRINPAHTRVPGPDGERGFGGACLPKDLAHYVQEFKDLPTQFPYVSAGAQVRNRHDRKEPQERSDD